MKLIRRQLARLALCIAFFTRLPVPAGLLAKDHGGNALHRAACWYPATGLLIGIFPAAVWLALSGFLPANLAALLAVSVSILVTGALHEDGLADCADGFGASRDREKILAIMRDSRIGGYGAIALIVSVLIRAAALAALPAVAGALALLVTHAGARASLVTALAFSRYARETGLGSMVAAGVALPRFLCTLAVALAIALALSGINGLAALGAGLAVSAALLAWCQRRIGGYTGDVLGAMEQAAEMAMLLCFVVLWGSS